MQKAFLRLELFGIFFVCAFSLILQNLYSTLGGLAGVMFGSVNDSIWEVCKTILFSYIIWSMIELLSLKPNFYNFVVAKTVSLYVLCFSYIMLCVAYSLFNLQSHTLPEFIAELVCICFAHFLSYKITFSERYFKYLFIPCLFLLLLFIAVYCSFTPFPPHIMIFADRITGGYGLDCAHLDAGAEYLNAFYMQNH